MDGDRTVTRRRWLTATAVTGVAALAGCRDDEMTPTSTGDIEWFEAYNTVEVAVRNPAGGLVASATAAIADTASLRFQGLSGVPALPPDSGMLFVYGGEAERRFVMRGMQIGIDIVYADSEGTITRIHHAPAPGPGEDGNDQQYPGYGQYVLELPYRWTEQNGVETGDVLQWDERLTPRA